MKFQIQLKLGHCKEATKFEKIKRIMKNFDS